MLGDAQDWDALKKAQSIILGSPETVYRQIMDIIRETQVGNLLIQFHMGNMRDDLARKSMRLFATEVAPRLREDSRVSFASNFPELVD
jgi:alkanesulfonate monooxygenase SsuD/methylene tetrahydromethanopterin reductase-like flavin-dependent oxidoreductase (luciferase family)